MIGSISVCGSGIFAPTPSSFYMHSKSVTKKSALARAANRELGGNPTSPTNFLQQPPFSGKGKGDKTLQQLFKGTARPKI